MVRLCRWCRFTGQRRPRVEPATLGVFSALAARLFAVRVSSPPSRGVITRNAGIVFRVAHRPVPKQLCNTLSHEAPSL